MRCEEVRLILESSQRSEHPPELSAHLATCDSCLEFALVETLATPAAVAVPAAFADRVILRLPQSEHARNWPRWPILAAAALSVLILAAGLWLILPESGAPQGAMWAAWYWALFLVAAGESAVLIAWAWEPSSQMDGLG